MASRRALRACAGVILASAALVLSPLSYADTLTQYIVASSPGSISNNGLTSSGTLVLFNAGPINYTIFTPPDSYMTVDRAPGLPYDNGMRCTPSNTSAYSYVAFGVCNGGYEVFEASVGGSSHVDLYDGPDPLADLVTNTARGGYDNILLNSEGDFAVVAVNNGRSLSDQNLLFIRSETPEPSSLVLLGTGLMGAIGVTRRKLRGNVSA